MQETGTGTAIGAVDIGGTKIAVGVVDTDGQVKHRNEFPTEARRGPRHALERIQQSLRQAIEATGASLEGIGIGATGPVDPMSGEFGNVEFLPGWEGFNLVQAVEETLSTPAAMENDADAAALGEAAFGAGRGVSRFIYITVSTGIGAGLVFDGKLYRGVDGAHPEIGHLFLDPAGPVCTCGGRGCWESLASGSAVSRYWEELSSQRWEAQQVFEAAKAGDERARQVVDRCARYLGLGLATLVTTFAPEVIALGGGVMRSRHLFWDGLQGDILRMCRYVPAERVRLVPAGLGEDTGLAGAASVWLHRQGRMS
jgi:glucokinase